MISAHAVLDHLRARTAAVSGVLAPERVSTGIKVAEEIARENVNRVTDARRIRALPERDIALEIALAGPGGPLDLTPRFRVPGGTMTLHPVQNLALHAMAASRGAVLPLGVGSGKTILSLLAPLMLGAERPILLIPPALQIPLRRTMEDLAKHFTLPKNLWIVPYSQLSVAKSTALLEQRQPDLIVADECFPYDTLITTEEGDVPIGKIVDEGHSRYVLSYDKAGCKYVWRRIVRRLRKERSSKMVRVVHERGIFCCTPNHRIWTLNRGYSNAGNLTSADYVLSYLWGDEGSPAKGEGPSNMRSSGVPLRVCRPAHGGGETSNEDEGPPRMPHMWGDFHPIRVRKARRTTGHLLKGVYGCSEVAAGSTEGAPPEDICSCRHPGGVRFLRKCLRGAEKGEEHSEVLLSVLRVEEQQPARLTSDRCGESKEDACEHCLSAGAKGCRTASSGSSSTNERLPHMWRNFRVPSGADQEDVLPSLRTRLGGIKDAREDKRKDARVCGAHAPEQPIFSTRGSGEDVRLDARPHVSISGGQREAHTPTGSTFCGAERCADGVRDSYTCCCWAVPVPTPLLQSRHRHSGATTRDRGRREDTQHPQVEVSRPAENGSAHSSRVVRVSVYEPGSDRERGEGCGEGTGSVYDLEIEDTHNYLANGVVVSNCHNIRNPDAARTKRALRYFRAFPNTRFVALSGTLTSRSLRDYAHLCELALRDGSPLPTDLSDLFAWANCIDADAEPQDRDWSIFSAFADVRGIADDEARREAAREIFRRRFTTAPGVVVTTESSVACSLVIATRPLEVPPVITEALADLERSWCRPDGEEMDSALAKWRLAMQLSQGYYLRWVWPGGVVDKEWLEARARWHREVRYALQTNRTGQDSPFLIYRAVVTGTLTTPTLVAAWHGWDAVRDRPKPPTEAVWLSDFLLLDALAWRREHPQGLIWHSDPAVEVLLRQAGEPTYGRGEIPPGADGGAPTSGGMAVSVRVHGTGLDGLQLHHAENLILSWPGSGKTCEQLIGRTHRQRQPADDVWVWRYGHTPAAREALVKAREEAKYLQETQGSPQKLCYATYL